MLNLRLAALAMAAALATAATANAQATKPGPEAQPSKFVEAPPTNQQPNTPGTAAPAKVGEANQTAATGSSEKQQNPFDIKFLLLMGGVIVLMFFISGRSRRKQEAKQKEMLSNLKKGDKITTIGGVVGTIVEVREDEITVKVDETNNVRMKFARWAIRGIGQEAKTEKPEEKK